MNIGRPLRRSGPAVPVAALALMVAVGFDGRLFSQAPAKVDFARDVQPLLKERCVGCHGPSQQMSGYRLDRRSTALGGVVRANIVPGSSESSRLYRRLTSAQFGPQMPPTGILARTRSTSSSGGLMKALNGRTRWPTRPISPNRTRPPRG